MKPNGVEKYIVQMDMAFITCTDTRAHTHSKVSNPFDVENSRLFISFFWSKWTRTCERDKIGRKSGIHEHNIEKE